MNSGGAVGRLLLVDLAVKAIAKHHRYHGGEHFVLDHPPCSGPDFSFDRLGFLPGGPILERILMWPEHLQRQGRKSTHPLF